MNKSPSLPMKWSYNQTMFRKSNGFCVIDCGTQFKDFATGTVWTSANLVTGAINTI